MLIRREFIFSLAALASATPLFARMPASAAADGLHSILMLNADPNDPNTINVFAPAFLRVSPGDSIRFIPADAGHNSASKRGMIPEGAEPWNSAIDEELTVTLTVPGIYGYICLPHYELGMVGLIVVGDDLSHFQASKKIRHPGDARKNFRALFKELEKKA